MSDVVRFRSFLFSFCLIPAMFALHACGGSQPVDERTTQMDEMLGQDGDQPDESIDASEGAPKEGVRDIDEADDAPEPYSVVFRDREVNLEPFVQGFPYGGFQVEREYGYMLYLETTPEGTWLRHLELPASGAVDLAEGRKVGDIDWSTRNFWGGQWHEPSARFLFRADEANEERINLYLLDVETGELEAHTDHDYVYGFGQSDDGQTLGWVARHGETGPFTSCLMVQRWGEEPREVLCDEGSDDRFTWTGVHFDESAEAAIVRVQHDGNRNTTNLARVDLTVEEPELELLLERGVKHYRLGALADSFRSGEVYYLSAREGYDNVYRYDFADGESMQLTDLSEELSTATLTEIAGEERLVLVLRRVWESEIQVRSLEDAEVMFSETSAYNASLFDIHEGRGVLRMSSVDTPFRMEYAHFDHLAGEGVRLDRSLLAGVPDELAETLLQCDAERVSFPTFDTLEDGSRRMLHGYILRPREEVEDAAKRMVRMTAFYGGGNFFHTSSQIMCAAGVATFSPSPRGSSGFGADFAALNDGDLGGDEIIDLFHAARFLEDEYGYESHQIGLHGGSHGGYAVMRAMTFPPETNDRGEFYPFGFGLSHAGFSDIISFYHESNIPDWVVLEAGDPETEEEKLIDRSPISHVERLERPLLLTHGENDSRVPVSESRRFASKVAEVGGPVTYVEFEGQGHGITGLSNTLRFYRAQFGFLEQVVAEW